MAGLSAGRDTRLGSRIADIPVGELLWGVATR
jgi:hypothetical protein